MEAAGKSDGWRWVSNDEETRSSRYLSLAQGWPSPRSHFDLWLTSSSSRPCPHSAVTCLTGGIQECTVCIWMDRNSQPPTLLFYSHSLYTTHAHHRNTCSTTVVQPQTVIPWLWELLQTDSQSFLLPTPTSWPADTIGNSLRAYQSLGGRKLF